MKHSQPCWQGGLEGIHFCDIQGPVFPVGTQGRADYSEVQMVSYISSPPTLVVLLGGPNSGACHTPWPWHQPPKQTQAKGNILSNHGFRVTSILSSHSMQAAGASGACSAANVGITGCQEEGQWSGLRAFYGSSQQLLKIKVKLRSQVKWMGYKMIG